MFESGLPYLYMCVNFCMSVYVDACVHTKPVNAQVTGNLRRSQWNEQFPPNRGSVYVCVYAYARMRSR